MAEIHFEWDKKKSANNKKKHKVSFEEAETVFHDVNARLIADPDHSEGEDRFVLLGMSEALRVLVVCHCYRENETVIRFISARKAKKHEIQAYEEHLK